MMLAFAMGWNDLIGLIIAVLVTAYLVYALLCPEKL
jgi:K+-transporting ATPase KdpF subunit